MRSPSFKETSKSFAPPIIDDSYYSGKRHHRPNQDSRSQQVVSIASSTLSQQASSQAQFKEGPRDLTVPIIDGSYFLARQAQESNQDDASQQVVSIANSILNIQTSSLEDYSLLLDINSQQDTKPTIDESLDFFCEEISDMSSFAKPKEEIPNQIQFNKRRRPCSKPLSNRQIEILIPHLKSIPNLSIRTIQSTILDLFQLNISDQTIRSNKDLWGIRINEKKKTRSSMSENQIIELRAHFNGSTPPLHQEVSRVITDKFGLDYSESSVRNARRIWGIPTDQRKINPNYLSEEQISELKSHFSQDTPPTKEEIKQVIYEKFQLEYKEKTIQANRRFWGIPSPKRKSYSRS